MEDFRVPRVSPWREGDDIFSLLPSIPDASSGDGILRTNEQMEEWAEQINCKVVKPKDNELFIDIDSEESYEQFKKGYKILEKHFITKHKWKETLSKQGLPHRHITVTLHEDHTLMLRIALQACLGSDLIRELLSLRRCLNGEENVVVFFEPNEEIE